MQTYKFSTGKKSIIYIFSKLEQESDATEGIVHVTSYMFIYLMSTHFILQEFFKKCKLF